MKLSESIKPISMVKAHMSEIVEDIGKSHKKIIITHNGEARAVLLDIESFEQIEESLAMLKIIAQSTRSLQKGKAQPIGEAFSDIRKKINEKKTV